MGKEIDAYHKFLRDITELVREQYGELTVYRLMYGELPYTKEGKLEIEKLQDMYKKAEPLQDALWKVINKEAV